MARFLAIMLFSMVVSFIITYLAVGFYAEMRRKRRGPPPVVDLSGKRRK